MSLIPSAPFTSMVHRKEEGKRKKSPRVISDRVKLRTRPSVVTSDKTQSLQFSLAAVDCKSEPDWQRVDHLSSRGFHRFRYCESPRQASRASARALNSVRVIQMALALYPCQTGSRRYRNDNQKQIRDS